MISVITCSISKAKLALLQNSLQATTSCEYELIAIDNSNNNYSICQAYNLGARKSKFDVLCFVHEDIEFLTPNWDQYLLGHLKEPDIALLGILGNTVKTIYPSGVYSPVLESNRINQVQKLSHGSDQHYYINPLEEKRSEVATLDGMLLGTTKKYWEKANFDEALLEGFHGYDVDFSLAMGQLGKVVVVYDILIAHSSFGGNNKTWIENQIKIVKKWRSYLPICKGAVSKKMLKERERADLNDLMRSLLKLNSPFGISLKYAWLAIRKTPFQRINLHFIKKLFLKLVNAD
ncbi:glycosyltransferase [Pedobacter jeongneungensis]|uniref:glycosyltransferase n=1 Tax=Pedobacter jeongneungensis TaxID=947309 RepID=UPI00046AD21D|nr:glycosyltransferase [Pedobacter jeongneungensis]